MRAGSLPPASLLLRLLHQSMKPFPRAPNRLASWSRRRTSGMSRRRLRRATPLSLPPQRSWPRPPWSAQQQSRRHPCSLLRPQRSRDRPSVSHAPLTHRAQSPRVQKQRSASRRHEKSQAGDTDERWAAIAYFAHAACSGCLGSGIASGRRRHADANVRGSPFGKERAARSRRLSHMGPGDSSSRRSAGSRHPSTVTPVGLAGPPAQNETAQANAGAKLDHGVRGAEPRDASP